MAHGRPMNRLFANATECDQTLWTRDFSCAHKPDRWPSIQAAEAVALTWAAELHKESDFAQPIHPKVRAKRSYAMLCMLQSSRRCQNSHAHFAFLCIVCPSDPPSVYQHAFVCMHMQKTILQMHTCVVAPLPVQAHRDCA